MYFSRIALFVLPVIAAANVLPRNDDDGSNTCFQGTSQYCCNSQQSANSLSSSVKGLLAGAGFNADNLTGQVGVSCNPLTGAGAGAGGAAAFGATGCNQQTLCCQKAASNGAVAVNCTPLIGNA